MPLTPKGRVCFPEVYHAKAMNETSKPKYSVVLLFDKAEIDKDPAQAARLKDMVDAAEKACQEMFKCGLKDQYRGKPLSNPFRKSEEKPEYMPAGQFFVRFSTMKRPGVVDASKRPISGETDDFYAGCFAHASYTVYAFDEGGNRGVAFGLSNIQKIQDGERMGGKTTTPDEDFEELEVASTDEIPF